MVVDTGSARGFVTVAGGEAGAVTISTGKLAEGDAAGGDTGQRQEFVLHCIKQGQSCIVHGGATVIFVRSLLQG